jgi:hypothetical protein
MEAYSVYYLLSRSFSLSAYLNSVAAADVAAWILLLLLLRREVSESRDGKFTQSQTILRHSKQLKGGRRDFTRFCSTFLGQYRIEQLD